MRRSSPIGLAPISGRRALRGEDPLTGEADCLLATIRHTNAATSPSLDWNALLELAESHGLFMLFCRDFQGELPPDFISRQRTQWTTSALMAAELGRLLQEFSLRGIEVLPLKGPLLASLLYGSPSLRICDDLDLLVQGEDLPRGEVSFDRFGLHFSLSSR